MLKVCQAKGGDDLARSQEGAARRLRWNPGDMANQHCTEGFLVNMLPRCKKQESELGWVRYGVVRKYARSRSSLFRR